MWYESSTEALDHRSREDGVKRYIVTVPPYAAMFAIHVVALLASTCGRSPSY